MISAVIKYKDNTVSIHSSETDYVGKTFTNGFYKAITRDGKIEITKLSLSELHLPFKTKDNNLLINTVDSFFSKGIKEKVKALGFTHKLGILLHGKQGCGKTSLMHFIAARLIENYDAIVLFCDSSNSLSTGITLSNSMREIQNNPIVFIADEFEQYCRDNESSLKSFLDGKDSIANSLFLGATNYIDKIPDTLQKRPSRFKVVMEIKGIDDKKVMKSILKNISDRISPSLFTDRQLDEQLKDVEFATLDELKHICLNKITNTYLPKSVVKKSTIGFKSSTEEDSVDEIKEDYIIWTLKDTNTIIYG